MMHSIIPRRLFNIFLFAKLGDMGNHTFVCFSDVRVPMAMAG